VDDSVVGIPLPNQSERESLDSNQTPDERRSGTFFVGPENQLVEVVVRVVLGEDPQGEESSSKGLSPQYNPIVLFGPSGTGKSHLALGLAAAYRQRHPRRKIAMATGVDFARELTDAIDSQATNEFRQRWRKARFVVLDDITRLAGKEIAQQEFIQTIDHATRADTPVLVTASQAPSRWTGILPTLQSRLAAGLGVALMPPQLATRRAILRNLASERDLPISEEVLELLAEGIQKGTRELIGALTQLTVRQETEGTVIDKAAARVLLDEHRNSAELSIDQIAKVTARTFSIRLAQLKSPSRRREVVTARNTAMFLARQLTGSSLERIGQYFGGRDHTTVQHGCQKIAETLTSDPAVEEAVDRIRSQLVGA
jgi:chromosomal replication initiator protein